MTKKKLKRFAENATFPHFFQPPFQTLDNGFPLKGNWKAGFFHNDHPIVIELGCGKGEFTTGLAEKYPEKNFIGMDIKGARMWRGAKTALEKNLPNVAFLRSRIELIENFFDANEIDEIWITFPDPYPQNAKARKRLTSPQFLERYRKVARPGCLIHLKTDNTPLFEYTLEVIQQENLPLIFATYDVDENPGYEDVASIQTFYEAMFREQGEKIKYLRFQLF